MKSKVLSNSLFLIKKVYKRDKLLFGYFAMYTITTAISPFISLYGIKFLIDELMGEMRVNVLILLVVSMFVATSIVNTVSELVKAAYEPRLIKFRLDCIEELQEVNMTMSFSYTEDPETLNESRTVWRAFNSNSDGIEGIFHKFFAIAGNSLTLIGYSGILIWLNTWLFIYLITSVIVVYVLTLRAKNYEYKQNQQISAYERKASYLEKTMLDFSYGKEIRMYQLKNWLARKQLDIHQLQLKLYKQIQKNFLMVMLVDALFIFIREGILYAYLIMQVIANVVSIGNFTLYAQTVANFSNLLKSIMEDIAFIIVQNQYVTDLRRYMDKTVVQPSTNNIQPVAKSYEIEFVDVTFKYPKSENYIFKNLNLTIKAGEKLAIVGINGAGKTTLIKLLTRLYEPTSGKILLNGHDIKTMDLSGYYDLFSVVFQDVKVLAFSIAENVASTSSHALDASHVLSSLAKAGLMEKVNTLPKGIETMLLKNLDDEGIELSGGQNQKLALARALYKNGSIIVLDEPTSALDALAEYEIYQKFNEMIEEKTAIYVSHRLSSTRFCDVIAYFENGQILEYGTHEQLLNLAGHYANMFNVQSQYYQDEKEAVSC